MTGPTLAPYRNLLTIPGSRPLILASVVGRMSASMMALGTGWCSGSLGAARPVAVRSRS